MTGVYTAGPDGRCTVCQRPESEHAPEAWTADPRACLPAICTACGGPIDDDGECRCPSEPQPTNTLRAMRLCPRCERPMVDHDDGACPEVTAETVTADDVGALRRSLFIDGKPVDVDLVIDCDRVVRALTIGIGAVSGIPHWYYDTARDRVVAAINARAKGGGK